MISQWESFERKRTYLRSDRCLVGLDKEKTYHDDALHLGTMTLQLGLH